MAGSTLSLDAPESLSTFLYRTECDPRPVVMMTCGIAGRKDTDTETIFERVADW